MDALTTYSNQDIFRLTGTLPVARIEQLLDAEETAQSLDGIEAHISEAKGCFAAEDCLADLINDIQALAKGMRGENRKALLALAETAEERQRELAQEGEYGADELRQALKAIDA